VKQAIFTRCGSQIVRHEEAELDTKCPDHGPDKSGLEQMDNPTLRFANKPGGIALLRDPRLNKSTAFGNAERENLGLLGLVPETIETIELQVARAEQELKRKASDLEKYSYLSLLQGTNETLFYRLLMSDPARFLPLIYTPAVGEACLELSHILPRPNGLYLSINHRGKVRQVLRNWPQRDIRIIVVTSGQRVLGLGDLGANSMPIPIGKLVLYTACAGVPPQYTLPIVMDCGTTNAALLDDPLYLGLRRPRPAETELDDLVEEFVRAVQEEFPYCCIQFEDWARGDAFRLLARYRHQVCCFNDDIQGTGAVALAGILSALRVTGGSLRDQCVLFLGAGSAAVGIANLLSQAIIADRLAPERSRERIWMFNRNGLIESGRSHLADYQLPFIHPHEPLDDFYEAIESIRPSIIIGVSTAAKAFDRQVIEAMARINERPIIFALSNPTSRSECTAEEAYAWSGGRALFASGSPFAPVRYNNRTLIPSQCNNMYVFPAIGIAVYATRAARVTDNMFIAAARALTDQVNSADVEHGLLYPPQANIFDTEVHVAESVAQVVFSEGLAGVEQPRDLRTFIESQLYRPEYSVFL
jgi:malate dehydrogenase (oxaloacetate-decarboxylating)(NADP+)